MATGTECVIGKKMVSQRPLNEWYLNEAVTWVDQAEVLAGIPIGSRSNGLMVKIGTALYWFKADLTTLELVSVAMNQTATQVLIDDAASIYDALNVEDALAEVKVQANGIAASIAALASTEQLTFRIDLGAYTSVATRVSNATVTTDYPTGWMLAASSTVNLLITHVLTGRKLSTVNIYEIDGANERLLPQFSSAFSGVVCNGLTVLIEGLAPTVLAIRIELIFN